MHVCVCLPQIVWRCPHVAVCARRLMHARGNKSYMEMGNVVPNGFNEQRHPHFCSQTLPCLIDKREKRGKLNNACALGKIGYTRVRLDGHNKHVSRIATKHRSRASCRLRGRKVRVGVIGARSTVIAWQCFFSRQYPQFAHIFREIHISIIAAHNS